MSLKLMTIIALYRLYSVTFLGATAYTSARFGAGTGPIVMTNVRCPYIESRLMDCPFDLNHNSCGHDEDAGVRCSSSTTGLILMISAANLG